MVERLLHPRVRTGVLVGLSVLLTGAAVVLGLPPQPDLPQGFGRIIALPELPPDEESRAYTVALGWRLQNFSRTTASFSSDVFWTDSRAIESEPGLPVYLAVFDDETAESLLACASDRRPRNFEHDPKVTEIPALPPSKNALLDTLVRHETGGPAYGYRFLRLDDVKAEPRTAIPYATCAVDPSTMITADDVELHAVIPEITVVTPIPDGARRADRVWPMVGLTGLPSGWSPTDVRGVNGTRIDDQYGISWKGTDAVARVSGQPLSDEIGVRVMTAGSGTVEATSLTAARQADRKLFWSGLLVGIAGSCLLLLFESLPWRSGPRTRTPSSED